MRIEEHDRAVLTRDLPEEGFAAGDVGTVVSVHEGGEGKDPAGYTLEFFSVDGETLDVVTVPAEALRPASGHEVLHSRTR